MTGSELEMVLSIVLTAAVSVVTPVPVPVPADVRSVAAATLPAHAEDALRSFGLPHDDVRVDAVAQVYDWSAAVYQGKATDDPLDGTQTWAVALSSAGRPVGTAYLRRDAAGRPAVVSLDENVERAAAVAALQPDEALVVSDDLGDLAVTSRGAVRPAGPKARAVIARAAERGDGPSFAAARDEVVASFRGRAQRLASAAPATGEALVGGALAGTDAPTAAQDRSAAAAAGGSSWALLLGAAGLLGLGGLLTLRRRPRAPGAAR